MRRGQAFDTMMLVISVIVAIAILGVLLSIIGGIGGGIGNDAKSSLKQDFQQVQSQGYGCSQPKKALDIPKDFRMDARELVGDRPVTAEEIGFTCGSSETSDEAICERVEITDGTNPSIETQTGVSSFKAWGVICGDDTKTDSAKYWVGVGSSAKAARDAALEKLEE